MNRIYIALLLTAVLARSQTATVQTVNATSGKVHLNDFWIHAYFGSGSSPEPATAIEWGALTHLCYEMLDVTSSSGTVSHHSSPDTNVVFLAHQNNVKVTIGVQPNNYFNLISTNGNLSTFSSNINNIITTYNYDGVDIDYEDATGFNTSNISNILVSLRATISPTKILTWYFSSYQYGNVTPEIVELADRVNVGTYNSTCTFWTWFNNPLYGSANRQLDNVIHRLPPVDGTPNQYVPWTYGSPDAWYGQMMYYRLVELQGLNPRKLNFSTAFYGWDHSGGTPVPHGPWLDKGTPPQTERSLVYRYSFLSTNYNLPSIAVWDETARVSWFPTPNGYIEYEDERAVAEKCRHVINKGLGGISIWNLYEDYDASKNPNNPLLHTIRKTMCRP